MDLKHIHEKRRVFGLVVLTCTHERAFCSCQKCHFIFFLILNVEGLFNWTKWSWGLKCNQNCHCGKKKKSSKLFNGNHSIFPQNNILCKRVRINWKISFPDRVFDVTTFPNKTLFNRIFIPFCKKFFHQSNSTLKVIDHFFFFQKRMSVAIQPAEIAFLGPEGHGKSLLIEAFLGHQALPLRGWFHFF